MISFLGHLRGIASKRPVIQARCGALNSAKGTRVAQERLHEKGEGVPAADPSLSLGALSRFRVWLKGNAVLSVAFLAALVTCFIVPPDGAYLDYVDVKTIACLYAILAVVGAMRNLGVFQYAAKRIIHCFGTCKSAVAALVGVTLVVSMVATNDMALIMMLPLSAATLLAAGWGRVLPFTFVMQNLAANLGGMILPFGNPQNLYLFEYFHIELVEFLQVMALPFGVSVLLIAVCCAVLVKSQAPSDVYTASSQPPNYRIRSKKEATQHRFMHLDGRARRRLSALVYVALMVLVILAVFRLIPYAVAALAVTFVLVFMDRKAIQTLDYGLLLTFVFFFIFAGNMSRIPAVDALLSGLMSQWPLAVSAGLSQIISNVPAAVLLSHFTDFWQPLLIGVNIGGAGTIVGSLASLITLQHYRVVRVDMPSECPGSMPTLRFIGYMTAYNVVFLAILFIVCSLS